MDALTFRNSQLTRRVEILQQESEQTKSQKQAKNKQEITNDVNSVISEELALKIAENAKLHDELNGVDEKYEGQISGKYRETNCELSRNQLISRNFY